MKKIYLKLIMILLAMVLFIGCNEQKASKEKEIVIRPVRYIKVYAQKGDRVRTFSGVSQAALESKLSFKVNGSIEKFYVKVGERVKKGQKVAILDDELYRLKVQEARAGLVQVKATLRSAENNYKRIQQLYVNKSASQNDLDTARAQYESYKASVLSMKKKLEQASLQLTYTKLYAPVAGAIADIPVEQNENIQAGQSVALLSTSTKLEVNVVIPEALIVDIKEGSQVDVVFDSIPEKSFSGTVIEVGVSSLDSATTFPVTVKIDNKSSQLRPGMAAEVAFKLQSHISKKRFIVPTFSIANDGEKSYAYLVKATDKGLGIVTKHFVTTGDLVSGGIEVFDGLKDGDNVLTAGISKVYDGLIVKMDQ